MGLYELILICVLVGPLMLFSCTFLIVCTFRYVKGDFDEKE